MAVVTLGSEISPTVIGGEGVVTIDTTITTLPISSPIQIIGTGAKTDSYWDLSANKLLPDSASYTVGLGTVDTGTLADNLLLYDPSGRVIKQIAGSSVATSGHTHVWTNITNPPSTISGYGIVDPLQPLDARLTSISGLTGVAGFLTKSGATTLALDTNTYSVTGHTHTYEPELGNPASDDYILSSKADGTRSWVVPPTGGGSGVTDHGMLTGLSDNDHTQYALVANPVFSGSFGFTSSNWRLVPVGNDLVFKFNTASKVCFKVPLKTSSINKISPSCRELNSKLSNTSNLPV